MTNPSFLRKVAAVVLVLAVPFAVAWVVGDLSETDDLHPDYVLRPPEIPATVELTLGLVSVVLVIASTAVLAWAWRQESPEPGSLSVLLPLVAVGVMVGFAWRVMTAAVIGANIGAGLVVIFGIPIAFVLIVFAGISAWRQRRPGRLLSRLSPERSRSGRTFGEGSENPAAGIRLGGPRGQAARWATPSFCRLTMG